MESHAESSPEASDLKREIRVRMLAVRKQQAAARGASERLEIESRRICARAIDLPAVRAINPGSRVSCYVAMKGEVDTAPLIAELIATVGAFYAPRVSGAGSLTLHRVTRRPPDGFIESPHGVAEPDPGVYPETLEPSELDIIFVPGVAFDLGRRRIGFGKAYYDRLLAGAKGALKIGLAFEYQIVERLPSEPHDIAMDLIATENRLIQ